MPDRLSVLRPAPKPHRRSTWVETWGWWGIPAGLSLGLALGAAYAHMPWTAGAFVFIAVGLAWVGIAVGGGE